MELGEIQMNIRLHEIIARPILWFNTNKYRLRGVEIGRRSHLYKNVHIDNRRGKIKIGDFVQVSRKSIILSHYPNEKKDDYETIIEDNVVIFVRSIIYPGVRIGKNSIVSACSVVTKDVPSDVIVMGNPARVIGKTDLIRNKKR